MKPSRDSSLLTAYLIEQELWRLMRKRPGQSTVALVGGDLVIDIDDFTSRAAVPEEDLALSIEDFSRKHIRPVVEQYEKR